MHTITGGQQERMEELFFVLLPRTAVAALIFGITYHLARATFSVPHSAAIAVVAALIDFGGSVLFGGKRPTLLFVLRNASEQSRVIAAVRKEADMTRRAMVSLVDTLRDDSSDDSDGPEFKRGSSM